MRKHRWIALSSLLALAASAAPAAAQDAVPAATKNEAGYVYNFQDDPLQATGLETLGARISVLRSAARATLIRPRTAFVVELLKSVEHL